MITRIGLLMRNENMTPEEFDRHWRDIHGPLGAALDGLKSYYHHTVIERGDHPILGPWDLDGLSELDFEDDETMKAAFASDAGQLAKEDLALLLSDMRILVCERHVIVPMAPDAKPGLKRMTLIRRKPGMSDEAFRHEWLDVHAEMMRKWPNVLGYNQNLVIDRFHKSTVESASPEEVPIDGIVEIWFENEEKAAEANESQIVQDTLAHARDFLSEITPFLVTTRKVV
ncbi:EthD family reductase [Sinisalibacter aestuarii]|uniref:EthD domain-containing protein n=1 Tax=Sinisalibacter aestuarii TaxID=2949426 RepID=A0ABQ5LNL8_9RHOB|nr:EthD family reductase [Sinisalibacter aestuarii]GKY86580.1 hypothetical protein STA1M1_04490 [Sinisalibacter aestuarii]